MEFKRNLLDTVVGYKGPLYDDELDTILSLMLEKNIVDVVSQDNLAKRVINYSVMSRMKLSTRTGRILHRVYSFRKGFFKKLIFLIAMPDFHTDVAPDLAIAIYTNGKPTTADIKVFIKAYYEAVCEMPNYNKYS